MMSLLPAVLDAAEAGFCAIPAINNGEKRPYPDTDKWARYQIERPTESVQRQWFGEKANRYSGFGLVMGKVSANGECLEFEGRAVAEGIWDAFVAAAAATGLGDVLDRICAGYLEESPSGGFHLLYRCDAVAAGTKLVRRLATAAELAADPDDKVKTLAETKGEHDFIIVAPSNGRTHPTGKPWVLRQGSFATVATITADERAALLDLVRSFDQMPEQDMWQPGPRTTGGDRRPGDDFNQTGDPRPTLVNAGWIKRYDNHGGNEGWRRPGKSDPGISATWHPVKRVFYVFSSSTVFPDTPKAYSPFAVVAFVAYGGDFAAAAAALRDNGYGEPAVDPDDLIAAGEPSASPADTESKPAPSNRFFNKAGLKHATLRAAVQAIGPIRRGPGTTLWYYQGGVWLPDGDNEVRRRVVRLLGERHRRSHAEGIVSDLAAQLPFIGDDQPTRWINCRNGLLDWRTLELYSHTPDVPSTYQLAVEWAPDATCPFVDQWIAQVAPEDAINLLWEIMGTAIYPDQPFHRAVLLLGPGRNGKGTWLRLVVKLIGFAHVSAVALQELAEDRFSGSDLFGKVANIAGDLDARSVGNTDLFKKATGGDPIRAQAKYGKSFNFHNRATFLFSANEAPGTADHSDGFFSRWVVIPFTKLQIERGKEDGTIELRLHAELEGVLVKAVAGLRRAVAQRGYSAPATVTEATDDYRKNATPMLRFVEDRLEVTGDPDKDYVTRAVIYDSYTEWCRVNNNKPLATNRFYAQLIAADGKHRIGLAEKNVGRVVTGVKFSEATTAPPIVDGLI